MSNDVISSQSNRPHRDHFHPLIYRVAGGLVIWFVLSAWILFDRQNDTELPLAFVSVLLLMALLIPWTLSRLWRRYARTAKDAARDQVSLRAWGIGDIDVWQSSLHSADAAINMLLPLAAVAFGLTAIGIVFLLVARTAS